MGVRNAVVVLAGVVGLLLGATNGQEALQQPQQPDDEVPTPLCAVSAEAYGYEPVSDN